MDQIYYQTPNGYGSVTNEDDVPPDATIITKAEYDAIIAAAQAAQDQAAAEQLAASRAQWTLVHDALLAGGVADPAASILADAVGSRPPEDQG